MLLTLEVSNYKSFREKQIFSMVATSGREVRGNLLQTPRFDILKSAAVYGHNASGKTNLLDVLFAIDSIVVGSARGEIPTRVPRVDPFRLDPQLKDEASQFEIELLIGPHIYRYCIEATAGAIKREELRHRGPNKGDRWSRLLLRETENGESFAEMGTSFAGAAQRSALVGTTVPERSMIGHAAALNVRHARRVFDWFDKRLFFYKLHSEFQRQERMLDELAARLDKDSSFKSVFLPLVADADFGVVEARVVKHSDRQLELFDKFNEAVTEMLHKLNPEMEINLQPPSAGSLRLTHSNRDDSYESELPFAAESSGTRRFMALVFALLGHESDSPPRTVVIDELDSSLSPELVHRFLMLAHNPKYNPSGSQVIFSTHDRSLMDIPNLLRRDQIWIADKGSDGSTELFSFADFGNRIKPLSPKSRQFAAGRYGGVAEFGPLLEDVPREAEPQSLSLFEDQ